MSILQHVSLKRWLSSRYKTQYFRIFKTNLALTVLVRLGRQSSGCIVRHNTADMSVVIHPVIDDIYKTVRYERQASLLYVMPSTLYILISDMQVMLYKSDSIIISTGSSFLRTEHQPAFYRPPSGTLRLLLKRRTFK